jgi:hypothetical protein
MQTTIQLDNRPKIDVENEWAWWDRMLALSQFRVGENP